MQYLLKTKTPIWTGGVEGVCDTIHETGIIGSLRWWYEVILRGLGVFACDPTEADDLGWTRCPVGDKGNEKHCNACDLFGMTGLQRKFKINIIKGRPVYQPEDQRIKIKPDNPERHNGWYLGAGRIEKEDDDGLGLTITPFSAPESTKDTLEVLLCLLSKWGGIGARQQHGYGIFEIFKIIDKKQQEIFITQEKLNDFIDTLKHPKENEPPKRRTASISMALPKLNNFFFAKIKLNRLEDNWQNKIDGVPTITNQRKNFDAWHENHTSRIFAPSLKNQLRFAAFTKTNDQRALFGYSDDNDNKCGAKVNVSHAYDLDGATEVRVWGEIALNRACLCNDLFAALNNPTYWQTATGCEKVNPQIIEWREVAGSATRCSKRGTVCTTPCTDAESFLECLLL